MAEGYRIFCAIPAGISAACVPINCQSAEGACTLAACEAKPPPPAGRQRLRELRVVRPGRPIGKISAKCWSFSAVSEPIFASKYAFCSIFQDLPVYHCIHQIFLWNLALFFSNFATFAKLCWIVMKISDFHTYFCENVETAAVQKYGRRINVNLVELENAVKRISKIIIFLQNFVLIQPRMSTP